MASFSLGKSKGGLGFPWISHSPQKMLCTNSLCTQKIHMRHLTVQSILHLPWGTLLRFSNLNKIFSAHFCRDWLSCQGLYLPLFNIFFITSSKVHFSGLPYGGSLLIFQHGWCYAAFPQFPQFSFTSALLLPGSSPFGQPLLSHFAPTWALEHT